MFNILPCNHNNHALFNITGSMMTVLNDINSFFSLSPKRSAKLAEVIGDRSEKKTLCSLSGTRWVERCVEYVIIIFGKITKAGWLKCGFSPPDRELITVPDTIILLCLVYIVQTVGSLLYFLSCRYKALESMWELLPYVVETLDEMRTDENFRSDRDDALRHVNSITFTFVYTLSVSDQVLSCTKDLCTKLQGMAVYLSHIFR